MPLKNYIDLTNCQSGHTMYNTNNDVSNRTIWEHLGRARPTPYLRTVHVANCTYDQQNM